MKDLQKKRVEGEIDFCRNIFIVSLRDMISADESHYSKKCKRDALIWIESQEESAFSFNNLVSHLFGDIDEEHLRFKIKESFLGKSINGTRNIIRILGEMKVEDEKARPKKVRRLRPRPKAY